MGDADEERPRTYLEEVVCEQGAPQWVVTFGDMISLLLTFFILLLSFSTVDSTRFQQMSGAIRGAFGSGRPAGGPEGDARPDGGDAPGGVDLVERLRSSVAAGAASNRPGRVDVEVFDTYRGVVVLFPAEGLFVEGTDQLRAGAGVLLDEVLREAVPLQDQFEVAVEVHAAAGGTGRFGSAFALTAAQALAVADYLRKPGGLRPGRVRPVGRGSAPPTVRPGRPTPASSVELLFLSAPMERR